MRKALETIAANLREVAREMDEGHPVSTDALHTAARQLDAQAEMIALGLMEKELAR